MSANQKAPKFFERRLWNAEATRSRNLDSLIGRIDSISNLKGQIAMWKQHHNHYGWMTSRSSQQQGSLDLLYRLAVRQALDQVQGLSLRPVMSMVAIVRRRRRIFEWGLGPSVINLSSASSGACLCP